MLDLIEIAVKNGETLHITRNKRQVTTKYTLYKLTPSGRRRLQALAFLNEWSYEVVVSHGIDCDTWWDIFKPVKGGWHPKHYLLWLLLSDEQQQEICDLELQAL